MASALPLSLNRLISIQAPGTAQDETGQLIESWAEVAAPWASILTTGGLETIRAGAVGTTVKTSIRVRYRLDLTAAMRVVHGATVYKILAVLPDEARRQHTDLVCEVIQ